MTDTNQSLALAHALEELQNGLLPTMRSLDKTDPDLDDWLASMRQRIISRLKGEVPLIVGLCGGGNAGKSTLFNALAGAGVSCIGPRAGLTRRALLAIPRPLFEGRRDLLGDLFHPFGGLPEPLPEDGEHLLTQPGPPLYFVTDRGLADAILVDMPDMDVAGNDGGYANRDNAKKVLAACDLLIMLASNTTYNNRDIAQFMRETVSGNGQRGAVLVYRFARPEANREHIQDVFRTMAEHLYPGVAQPPIVDCFVASEDAAVMDGAAPNLVPLRDVLDGEVDAGQGVDGLRRAISGIDRFGLNREDTLVNIETGLVRARKVSGEMSEDMRRIEEFRHAVEAMTSYYAVTSFAELPLKEFREKAAKVWKDQQNGFLKAGRVFGNVLRAPVKATVRAVKRLAGAAPEDAVVEADRNQARYVENASRLYQQLREEHLYIPEKLKTVRGADAGDMTTPGEPLNILEGARLDMPQPYKVCVAAISGEGFFVSIVDELEKGWQAAAHIPDGVEQVLAPIIREARKNMSAWQVAKEYAACLAEVVIPAVSVAYVVTTGDVATGSALGFLEATDLVAVAALPLASGTGALEGVWIQDALNGVVRYWQNEKTPILEEKLRKTISGDFIARGDTLLRRIRGPIKTLDASLSGVEDAFQQWAERE